ncbi:Carboxypeptidase [Podosphaera aphanis]|nr:Carboxypeptidase [Podosphaera aphanis]
MASSTLLVLLGATISAALTSPHEMIPNRGPKASKLTSEIVDLPQVKLESRYFLNENTSKFAVDGSALPEFSFDIGESYAGTLPISSDPKDPNQLWFWFFPSTNPLAEKEITLWLNGGPGCSSLDGLIQENGPFLWQPGTYEPIPNPYSWTNLTNMIYVDQPVSTGFSPGNITVNDQNDVANQFLAFWKNFITTFQMEGFKVYIAGESYAGQYIPYIASAMLDTNDTTYYNLKGIQLNDPSINEWFALAQAPAVPALNHYQNLIGLNETFMTSINKRAKTCGFTDFVEKYAGTFPPPGPIPTVPNSGAPECHLWDEIYSAVYYVNPCFNIYHLTDYCPYLWSILGFPSLAGGPNNYFNRTDIQKIINAPPTSFSECGGGPNLFPHGDKSLPSGLGPLPSVIERTNNVIICHGMLDFLLFANGSLITIQNMTWNGYQGFQTAPSKEMNLLIPYHQSLRYIQDVANTHPAGLLPQYDTAGAGLQGHWHTERGLTFVTVNLAGHMVPQYTPGVAYRQLEFLLGRIKSLDQPGDYTTQTGNFTASSYQYLVHDLTNS